jgi:hypothetical protein
MSFHTSKTLVRALTPALAAVLLHIGTAAAAEHPAGDAQEQARAILLGTSALHPTAQSAVKTQGARGDAQESARGLLLGVTTPASGQPQQSDVRRATQKHVHGDAQMLAREVLLGHRDAVVAGS